MAVVVVVQRKKLFTYTTMNIFHFVLLYQFILLEIAGGNSDSDRSDSSECALSHSESESSLSDSDTSVSEIDISISDSDSLASESDASSSHVHDEVFSLSDIKIKLVSSPHHSEDLHFTQTNGMLANIHLPIWTITSVVSKKSGHEQRRTKLTRKLNVMKKLGQFIMYQDPATKSAAVYFHRRCQFDGMIDYRYRIQGLPVDIIHPGSKTRIQLGTHGVIPRSQSIAHAQQMSANNDGVQEVRNINERRSTYGNRLYDGYPEILVIVSYDVAKKFLKDSKISQKYTSIVSYVLTLFNGADMFYSNLKETNIKLNLAGIIIATESESLAFLQDCYIELKDENTGDETKWLHTNCAMDKIRTYLYDHMMDIPLELYDLTVFLTRYNLYTMQNELPTKLVGHSEYVNSYEKRLQHEHPTLVSVIQDNGDCGSHVIIAHELAHMMSVLHDTPPLITNEGDCCGYIMKPASDWCKTCLSWSDTSEEAFKLFFSSADCCLFINEPRSLYPPGQKMALTAEEQCQCYGYTFTVSSRASRNIYCETNLQCIDDDNIYHSTVLPMYGTPCNINKVCWDWKCKKINDFKFSKKNREPLPGPSKKLA